MLCSINNFRAMNKTSKNLFMVMFFHLSNSPFLVIFAIGVEVEMSELRFWRKKFKGIFPPSNCCTLYTVSMQINNPYEGEREREKKQEFR